MEKNSQQLLEDLKYIYASGIWQIGGKRWIDSKRYLSLIEQLENQIQIETQEAREIQNMCEEMVESTKTQCKDMIRQSHDYIESLDPVAEAKKIARQIIEQAQEDAIRIRQEAEEVQTQMIKHGEDVRNKFISQGQDYVEDLFKEALNLLRKQSDDVEMKTQQLAAYMQKAQESSLSKEKVS